MLGIRKVVVTRVQDRQASESKLFERIPLKGIAGRTFGIVWIPDDAGVAFE